MSPVTPAGVLVGRESELALLHGLLREAAKGCGRAVLIEGEPGIGKTTLVRALLAKAPELRCEVFWGVGDELGQEIPLAPFIEALRVREPSASIRRDMAAKLLRGELSVDRGDTMALAEQLLALVSEQCEARPTILVIDDIQWADPASVSLWGRLSRMAENRPLLLIATMRPVPQRDDLVKLRRVVGTEARVQLTALPDPAVAELVAHRAGGKPEDDLLRLADDAGGNPLYLTELVDALHRSDGLTVTDSGTVQLAGGSAPASLSAAIADRLDFVTGPVRETLRAAALLGVEFSVTDLATVLGRTVADLIPAIEEGVTGGVLTECGSDLKFRHPLIREALYDSMSTGLRAAWHRDAGRALAAASAPVDRVARQLLRAAEGARAMPGQSSETQLDDWVLAWLTSAADQLVSQAPSVAAELLAQAVASVSIGSERYGWLASKLAHALFRIGDREQAEQVANLALEYTSDPDLVVELHSTLAQCLSIAGSASEALATLERALAAPGLSARHRARLMAPAARTHVHLGEFVTASRVAEDALAAATEAGDNWAMGWALFVMATSSLNQGQLTDALPVFDRALTVTRSDPTLTDLRLLLQINKAATLANIDRYEEALAVATQARRFADHVGTAIRQAQVHGALSQILYETGRWDDALAEIATLAENLKEPAAACVDLATMAVILFHQGDVDSARRYLDAATPHSERLGQRFIAQLALAQSMNRELVGERVEALDALISSFDETEELGQIEDILVDTVRLGVTTGQADTAKKFAEHAATLAAKSQVPRRQANDLYCRGLLEKDPHRLMAAAARFEDASRPLYRAKALEAASEAFIAIDDRTQARDAFSKACEVYESLGAAADAARLQAVFRRHNIRRGPHSKHRKAQSGWESLTPMEAKVAAFVEDGMSNPEIAGHLVLSPRTVGTHVSHILKKLNVSSRADIARESALRSLSAR
jgi:DNA-binding CsgD family transcriptional regulator/tetratricopeptide (TPR) repeat protein